MHRVSVRLKDVKDSWIVEAYFDERLSLLENLAILEELCGKKVKDRKVYDPNKRIFLDRNIPLKEFVLNGMVLLELFN